MKPELLLDMNHIHKKLLELNGHLLKPNYKKLWSRENPTLGYCYILSEVLYHYIPENVKTYCISGDFGTHWFVKINGETVDFTKYQFNFEIDYSKAIGKGFFKGSIQTNKGYISKRGFELYQHLIS